MLGSISLGTFVFLKNHSSLNLQGYLETVRKLVVSKILENYFVASLRFPQNVIIHNPEGEATGKAR